MAKYEVTGFIAIKMTVNADSEDEAVELANESFDVEKHIEKDAEPDFQVANSLEDSDDEDDSGLTRPLKRRLLDDEDDDN